MDDFSFYKGYRLVWTGWKDVPNQVEIVGQWVAVPEGERNHPMLYACTSGTFGVIKSPGYVMNISKLDCMPWVWIHSSESQKRYVEEMTRERLIALIDGRLEHADL